MSAAGWAVGMEGRRGLGCVGQVGMDRVEEEAQAEVKATQKPPGGRELRATATIAPNRLLLNSPYAGMPHTSIPPPQAPLRSLAAAITTQFEHMHACVPAHSDSAWLLQTVPAP